MSKCLPRNPPIFKVTDYDGEVIEGSFYEPEIQKIKIGKDALYNVEKMLQKRTQRDEKQVLVK